MPLDREEIEQCFKPHGDSIVDIAKSQVNTNAGRSKVVFCSGGFGSNDYLLDRREKSAPITVTLTRCGSFADCDQ